MGNQSEINCMNYLRKFKNLVLLAMTFLSLCTGKVVAQTCEADFSFIFFDDSVGNYVAFLNTSNSSDSLASVHWDFGDGTFSANLNPVHQYANDGVYNVCLSIVTDSQCFDIECKPLLICGDCVWPGDANKDGIVNNLDLFNIGLAYDSTGPSRQDQSMNFLPHLAQDWSIISAMQFATGEDFKHADCNGDGIVNAIDTLAIKINYGLEAAFRSSSADSISACDPGIPELFFVISDDTVEAGDEVTIEIHLGTDSIPATNVFGIAFTLNYNNSIIDTTETIEMNFNGSDLGAPIISLDINFDSSARMVTSQVRTNHLNKTVKGKVTELSFVMEDNLIFKASEFSVYQTLHLSFSDVHVISNDESEIVVCAKEDSIVVFQIIDAVDQTIGDGIKIYPNPAKNLLTIELSEGEQSQLIITDVLGQIKYSENSNHQERVELDISNLSSGIYFLTIKDGLHNRSYRFEIIQ